MTRDECAWQIVEALNDLVGDLKRLADRYSDSTEREYQAGILAAVHYVNGCMAALALKLPVETEGEVIK